MKILLLSVFLLGIHGETQELAEVSGERPECVSVHAQASFQGYGYKHLIEVKNQCKHTVACQISSNVDPKPIYKRTIKSGKSTMIATRNGSPSSAFRAIVSCEEKK